MGNKCCSLPERQPTKPNRILTEQQTMVPQTSSIKTLKIELMKLESNDKEDIVELKKSSDDSSSLQESKHQSKVQSNIQPQENNLTVKPSPAAKRQMLFIKGGGSQTLDIPEFKASPTIRISKEWIGDDFNETHGAGGNLPSKKRMSELVGDRITQKPYQREKTMGAKVSYSKPEKIQKGPGTPDSQSLKQKVMKQQQQSNLMRKQSTIHQIQRLQTKKRSSQNIHHLVGQVYSPQDSDNYLQQKGGYGLNNIDNLIQSELSSQNSLSSLHLNKKTLNYLDMLLLSNQHALNPNGLEEKSVISETQREKKRAKKITRQGSNNLQRIGSHHSIDNGQFYLHSNTPQFHHDSYYARATSRSSNNDELMYYQNIMRQERDEQFSVDEQASAQNQFHPANSCISFGHSFKNPHLNINHMGYNHLLTSSFQGEMDNEQRMKEVEILEEDNESVASSCKSGRKSNKTVPLKKFSYTLKLDEMKKKNSLFKKKKNNSKFVVENHEEDSLRSSFEEDKMDSDEDKAMHNERKLEGQTSHESKREKAQDEPTHIPLEKVKSNESRPRELPKAGSSRSNKQKQQLISNMPNVQHRYSTGQAGGVQARMKNLSMQKNDLQVKLSHEVEIEKILQQILNPIAQVETSPAKAMQPSMIQVSTETNLTISLPPNPTNASQGRQENAVTTQETQVRQLISQTTTDQGSSLTVQVSTQKTIETQPQVNASDKVVWSRNKMALESIEEENKTDDQVANEAQVKFTPLPSQASPARPKKLFQARSLIVDSEETKQRVVQTNPGKVPRNLISMIRQQTVTQETQPDTEPIRVADSEHPEQDYLPKIIISMQTMDESRRHPSIVSTTGGTGAKKYIYARNQDNGQSQNRDILHSIKKITKTIQNGEEGIEQLDKMIDQKKQQNIKKSLQGLIKQSTLSPTIPIQGSNLLKTQLQDQNEYEDFGDLSEMMLNTQQSQDFINPSEFAYTPHSHNKSIYNPDASFDYSIIQIEYMAENNPGQQESVTPKSFFTKQMKDITPKMQVPQAQTQKNSNDPYKVQEFSNDLKTSKELQMDSKKKSGGQEISSTDQTNKDAMPFGSGYASGLKQSFTNLTQNGTTPTNANFQKLTKANLAKLDAAQGVDKSYDGTPKSQITRSVISGTDDHGKRKVNQYIILSDLGKGSYAEVKLCLNDDNKQKYAMKVLSKRKLNRIFISKTRTALADVEREIAVMKKLEHPNIVNLVEVLDDPAHDLLYIVMEYVPNGSLMRKLSKTKTTQLQQSWKYFRDLIQGLYYLHECAGVIHRDIKPENLLIDENDRIKIADFGVSFLMENGSDMITTTAGSNYYFAPEVCQGSTFKGRKSDIWASAVTLYQMVFKKYPFSSNNIPDLYHKIQSTEPDFPQDSNASLVDLIKRMLIKDPEKRASLEEIMSHDWVTSNGVNPMPLAHYPKIELTKTDTQDLFTNVFMITKIKMKLRNKINQRRLQQQRGETTSEIATPHHANPAFRQ